METYRAYTLRLLLMLLAGVQQVRRRVRLTSAVSPRPQRRSKPPGQSQSSIPPLAASPAGSMRSRRPSPPRTSSRLRKVPKAGPMHPAQSSTVSRSMTDCRCLACGWRGRGDRAAMGLGSGGPDLARERARARLDRGGRLVAMTSNGEAIDSGFAIQIALTASRQAAASSSVSATRLL